MILLVKRLTTSRWHRRPILESCRACLLPPVTLRHSPSLSLPFSSTAPAMAERLQQGDPRQGFQQPPFPHAQEQAAPGSDAAMNPRPDWGENSYRGSEKLKNGVALITGGDSGIGRAVAIAFAREGCDIAISYLPQEQQDAEFTKKWVEQAGKKCLLLPGDLRDPNYCKQIVEDTVNKFEKITILVNNAAEQGKSTKAHISEMSYDRVMNTFQTNIVSFFEVSKIAIKHMKPGSCIINTGSIQAYDPSACILDYACTKAAIVAFTKGLSQELIEQGIRVNCVAPGPVWTPLIPSSFPAEKTREFGMKKTMKRPAQPAELSPAYVYLASNETSSFVNGAVLPVTGGEITA